MQKQRGWVQASLLSLVFAGSVVGDWTHGRPNEDLFRSTFATSTEGWVLEGRAAGEQPKQPGVSLSLDGRALAGSDTATQAWYFTTPPSFAGDQSGLYNGALHFSLWHAEQPRGGTPGAAPSPKGTPDVVLVSSCGFQIELAGIVTPGRTRKTRYLVPLIESAAEWVDPKP